MKIILCKGQFMGPISGADETLVNYATHLRRAGHEVSVLLVYPPAPGDQYHARLRREGVPVVALAESPVQVSLSTGRRAGRGLLRALPLARPLIRRHALRITTALASRYAEDCREHLRRSGANVAHVFTPDASANVMIRAAVDAGIPVLYHELGIPFHPPEFKHEYEKFASALPLCTEIAALSPALARQCRDELPPVNALSIIPIFTDDPRVERGAGQRDPRDVTVGFAARLEHLKGPMVLLEAFAAASRRVPHLRLELAGAGSLQGALAARAETLGVASRCRLVGVYTSREERLAFMRGLDVFAMPSLTEGTPNSLVEAMSHELPSVASAVGGIPDMITPEVGLLVPPNDPAALADALVKLASDAALRSRMGRAAALRYEALFSPEVVLPVLLNAYHRTAAARRAPSHAEPAAEGCTHPWAVEDYSVA